MQASRQWATRPNDERFTSLTDLHEHMTNVRNVSRVKTLKLSDLSVAQQSVDNPTGLAIVGPDGGQASITNWGFNQLANKANVPPGYISTLPAYLAAENLNYGLSSNNEEASMLITKQEDDSLNIRAVLGPKYGRIWNSQVTAQLVDRFGNGIDGDWKVPGEFGIDVPITKDNTTIYGSDRDMFVFLADEKNKLEIPNRRDGKSGALSRGFFVWNSETGSQTFGIAFFFFDYACSNRIVWGAQEYKEIRIRHSLNAPDRWLDEVIPKLEEYGNAASAPMEQRLIAAQAAKIDAGDDNSGVDKFLKAKLNINPQVTTKLVDAIKAAHIREEHRPIETIWDCMTGATAHAKTIEFQDERVKLERAAGKLLDLVA